ncbi:MAG: NrfD/PsrC family molybdoenzyme membrane anchor subunit [Acidimicrobiales bacterium]
MTYYDRPVLKAPVWKWPVPAYFFTGGLAAGTSLIGTAARLTGDDRLARRCLLASLGATAVSTGLLIEDLGRPARFVNMLRVAKPTSPMSIGSWALSAFGAATSVAAAGEVLGVARPVARAAERAAAVLAPVVATYTAVLIADTAVPAWHEARHELPFVFAGGALASSGGLAMLLSPSAPVRRAAVIGATIEVVGAAVMHRRHGRPATSLSKVATVSTVAGAALAAAGQRVAAGPLLLAGALAQRFAVFNSGVASVSAPDVASAPA